ncbi:MAG: EAL domain-containing protein [Methylicorpusculum sp.]|nr:EAL domain-containing protein [Methylicorpusculum sp.]MDO8845705.1 EAL domain-containing protein [Methylicorpusculum sp.]MDO8938754.1 EAL domain-containing protein [Methylicorpusculum sp.]MDP2177005.1 EAL domain-containing protein [Methylicorpusculum sp.]MDP2201226.1 EAL domain-containing protein [Methylicorpusculum sp.]
MEILYLEDSAVNSNVPPVLNVNINEVYLLDKVSSLADAINRLEQSPRYQAVLLDLKLPAGDSLELLRYIRSHRLSLAVIVITETSDFESVIAAFKVGAEDYLSNETDFDTYFPVKLKAALTRLNERKDESYFYEMVEVLKKVNNQSELSLEQQALKTSTDRLSNLLAASPIVLYTLKINDSTYSTSWISDNIVKDFGYSQSEALAQDWWLKKIHPDDRDRVMVKVDSLLTVGHAVIEYRFYNKQGEFRWVRDDFNVLYDDNGNAIEILGAWLDITEQKLALEALRRSAAVFENTKDGAVITDLSSIIVAVNPAFCEITGYKAEEVLGKGTSILRSCRHDNKFYHDLWDDLINNGHWRGEIWNRRKNGELYPQFLSISTIHDELGHASNYVGVFTDISQIKQSKERLEHLAHYDPLTHLPNRLLIQSRLKHALEVAQRHGNRIAVLFIDLDHFKTVNDSMGHPMGDELLATVAQRLNHRLREEDSLGRLGGDEFLVVIEQMEKTLDAVELALSLLDRIAEPFTLSNGQTVFIGASIGISLFPDDADSVTELIQHSDSAMYLAKNQGRNTYRFYTEDLTRLANERLNLESRLRRALERKEFFLQYQPLIADSSHEIVGVEALLRWNDPELGIISPNQFIPLTEETGLIITLGEWVLLNACAQAKAWLDNGHPPLYVAVNLSPVQFRNQDVVSLIKKVLDETGLPAEYLELEITEGILMEQADQALITLANLKTLGVSLAVDDFGTGYSSLSYLKRFPLDKLKIDRSFVDGLGSDENDQAIVKAVIAMGHSLGIKTLAEGVETIQQLNILKQLGCQFYQGYLFGKPMMPGDIAKVEKISL